MTDCIVNSKQIMEELRAPFKGNEIEWRVQSASINGNGTRVLVLPYLTSRAIMNRLDAVCGGFWQSHYDKLVSGGKEAFQCRLSIKIGSEWITRTDAAEVTDIESVKGGHSNALKRAGVQWGIGRYLYELPDFWVELKNSGKHKVSGQFKINGSQQFLKGAFDTPKLPDWAVADKERSSTQQLIKKTTEQQSLAQSNHAPQIPVRQRDQERAVILVDKLLQSLQVPQNLISPLFEKVNGVKIPHTDASAEQLGKLYHVLLPVHLFVNHCREQGLDEDRMLYYAQITHKVELKNIFALFLKMTKETCEETLDLIKDDLKKVV